MMMMTTPSPPRGRPAPSDPAEFQLETLEALACGCVVAIQRLRLSSVTVVSLEAKGPHCPYQQHRVNKVIRLGEPFDGSGYEEEDGPAV